MEDLFSLIEKKKSEIAKKTGVSELAKNASNKPKASDVDDKPSKKKVSESEVRSPILPSNGDYDAKDIEVLEGLEAVRLRPGMYIGGTDDNALHHLASEVLDNSMDEAVAGHANLISMTLHADNLLEIADNGRGIPIDDHPKFPGKSALEVILTTLHSGGKFNNKAYNTSGGLHGVGSSVVNALSEFMVVEVTRDKKTYSQEYSRGLPKTKLEVINDNARGKGTKITFRPDEEIFGNRKFKAARLYNLAKSKAYLYSGMKINWACDESLVEGTDIPVKEQIFFENGIRDFLSDVTKKEPTIGEGQFFGGANIPNNRGNLDWAVVFMEIADGKSYSFCNTVPTPQGGTHETGFKTAMVKAVKEYADKSGNKKAEKISTDDIANSMTFVLSIFYPEPQFQGQTKDKLVSNGVAKLVETAVRDAIDNIFASDKELANSVIELILRRTEERLNRKIKKETQRKTVTSKLRLPGKLADCSSTDTDKTEIFFVDGDSAGGSAKQARNRNTQAILPIRGKILNVASATRDKIFANQEIKDMIIAFGCGTGSSFKEQDLRYGKIVIMTDADVDGAHIASLLMTFFYQEMRGLIEAGRLYLARPPLYRLKSGDKTFYADTDQERIDMTEKLSRGGTRKVEVGRFKGLGEMTPPQLKETTMNPESRSLLRVELEDDPEISRVTVDDLMGKSPEKRFKFIQANTELIENLSDSLDV